MPGPTLVRPPPNDPSKSPMENAIELTPLPSIGPDLFTNTRELFQPPGSRGFFGGAVIAQCLSAAQKTVPPPSSANNNAVFLPHSMHCYFVLAGDNTVPVLYHVERVREGRSFLTRTVQARQKGKCIFTTTISFVSEDSGGEKALEHGWDIPLGARAALEEILARESPDELDSASMGIDPSGPFVSKQLGIFNHDSPLPHARRPQAWSKCRGKISGGVSAHLSALAYMSDSWFIGTTARVHRLPGFMSDARILPPDLQQSGTIQPDRNRPSESSLVKNTPPTPSSAFVGMMVSLDHTIYFHRPREVKADEWLCTEMDTPWAGLGRGQVCQRIWNREGTLVASCFQEGLVRLRQDDNHTRDSKL